MTQPAETVGVVSEIVVYPIKSAKGISLDTAQVERCGCRFDRQWMLVDSEGVFLSQRQLPRMALISPRLTEDELIVDAPGMERLVLPLVSDEQPLKNVSIWGDICRATPVGSSADKWFSTFLKTPCTLVRFPESTRRPVDPTYAKPDDQVGFADGFPFLLLSQASLTDLNTRVDQALPMTRFRPNLVVSGCSPYAEDTWKEISIGDVGFRVVKPCARCSITTVDQVTGTAGKEPLRTLAGYRRVGKKVMFGQNLIHDGRGLVRTGDVVRVTAYW
ncbi:MAG: Flavodoxin reductases (ferredoxin-NADPH reductases) family 1 [uncultured Truepera sp.]|uniref:Flavodoxin reductases (Ferredoxin-NADPH reductases) family 1 n=1 Tax=uncultured Truepera sp. TaxID=543023 RepID=A0A6J4VX40_9DEIN|nr:MAG: Flavodoxin reductases (ferredoxin-NADPH reductases) family 1 [uncultured Truepera sp.]